MSCADPQDVAHDAGLGELLRAKLLAFATGAAFSGLAGALFASKLTSIFPHSFSLIISINVLSLIIIRLAPEGTRIDLHRVAAEPA